MGQIELLTKEEAAELLAVSETTVERLIAAGHLPAYRIGRAITRIDRADVLAYLESRRIRVHGIQSKVTMKEIKRQRRIRELPCGYVPGMKVVDPRG